MASSKVCSLRQSVDFVLFIFSCTLDHLEKKNPMARKVVNAIYVQKFTHSKLWLLVVYKCKEKGLAPSSWRAAGGETFDHYSPCPVPPAV